jgi:molybdopterin molybdotransferase
MAPKRSVTAEELQRPLVAYEDARAQILAAFSALDARDVAVADSLGLVAAADVVADFDVPGFDNSAMDGFAIRASDTSGAATGAVVLRLVDDLPAGTAARVAIEPGTAATIMTGAPLPPGADAVVPWEDTDRGNGEAVEVRVVVPAGKHVRPRGEDVRAGDVVIAAGTQLRPVHLGVLASIGRTELRAHPRPRVAVLSTGDELVAPGGALEDGKVFDANRALLRATCERAGANVVADALIGDDPSAIAAWLARAARDADLIVTSGGASVGEHDWIRDILEREGALRMWRVAMKPGKPVAFGTIGGTPVLALPGNPGSAFVGAHVFVQPAVRIMRGRAPEHRRARARLGAPVKGSPSRTMFARVRLDGEIATPLPAQSSVVLSNLMPADGFAIVPPGGLPADAPVDVELID